MAEAPLTCAGCALLCDDVTLGGDGALRPACPLGERWFATPAPEAEALVDGAAVSAADGLAAAVAALHGARRPLVHGFAHAGTEDVRAATALADRRGGVITPGALDPGAPTLTTASLRGVVSATLGEIRARADLILIWREDPVSTHPRLLERLVRGDDPPRLAAVAQDDTPTLARAELALRWPARADLAALSALAVLARGRVPGEGAPEPVAGALWEALREARHVAIVHGGALAGGPAGERGPLALYELVRGLSDERRAVTLALPATAGTRGAGDVVTWQTGYPGTVDLSAGHPELADPAAAGDGVDLVLAVHGPVPDPLPGVPRVAIGGPPDPGAAVWLAAATPGLDGSGTLHRADGVPLTVAATRAGDRPSAAHLLGALLAEVAA